MRVHRREFLKAAALVTAGGRGFGASALAGPRVGMWDWNLGPPCDPDQIPRAREAHLEGIQVSVGTRPDFIPLRDPQVRRRYLELGKRHQLQFHPVAAGSILNRIPLKSEPQSAVYVIDAVEAAASGSRQHPHRFFRERGFAASGRHRRVPQSQ